MSLNLSTDSLRSILSLSERRDALLAELQNVETEISRALGSGVATKSVILGHETGHGRTAAGSSPKVSAKGRTVSAKRGKRGAVKELILAGLKEAGEAGIAVRHLAAKLGLKPGSIHVWFGTTGKKSGLTEALGKGVYRLKESIGETPQPSLKAPRPKMTASVPKPKISAKKSRLTGKK